MNYTNGNWTVSSQYVDTVTTKKNLAITDLSYDKDYAKTMDEPAEARVTNVTASGLQTADYIRFGRSDVKDIYSSAAVDLPAQIPVKKGVQLLVELHETYTATNSVTGQEAELPCVGRVVLRFPSSAPVTEVLVADLIQRTVASCFATGETGAGRLIEMARGSLLPSGL